MEDVMHIEFIGFIVFAFLMPAIIAFVADLLHGDDPFERYRTALAITPIEVVVIGLVSSVVFCGMWNIVTWGKVTDTEFLNGSIASKGSRDWDREVCDRYNKDEDGNNTSCASSHYEYYTEYFALADFAEYFSEGRISFGDVDRGAPAPQRWVDTYVGQPVTRLHSYTNWVKGAGKQTTMFPHSGMTEQLTIDNMFPARAQSYHDGWMYAPKAFYIGGTPYENSYPTGDNTHVMVDASKLLMQYNAVLGPSKQANLQVFIVRGQPQEYANALMDYWGGGAKNDVNVFVGVSGDDERIQWSTVKFGLVGLDYSDEANGGSNIRLEVEFRKAMIKFDNIQEAGGYAGIVSIANSAVGTYFDRVPNKQFQALEQEVKPSGGTLTTIYIIAGVLNLIGCAFFYLIDITDLH
jgi:hypothetical protein